MSDSTQTGNQVPNQSGAKDILIFRGAEYWPTPEDVIREVHAQGLSVRIARNNIPEGLLRGLSRIALAHIKAVMTIEKGTEDDSSTSSEQALRAAFEALTQVEGHDTRVDEVLARTYEHGPSRWLEMPECDAKREIFERYDVVFKPGIFAYCYWTGTSYYLKPDETEAPEELSAKGIQAVRGIIAATGEMITDEQADVEKVDEEAAND